MFKVLNPYMLMELESIPITDIRPGPTPEKTFVDLDPDREENRGRTNLRIAWPELCGIHFKAKVNKRERIMTVPEVLLEFLIWVNKAVGSWKTTPARPWDPEAPVERWFSPYLRVASLAELKMGLAADIATLRAMIPK